MRFTPLSMAAMAVLFATGTHAQDKTVSYAEAEAARAKAFSAMDANKDGQLTHLEIRTALEDRKSAGGTSKRAAHAPHLFSKMDSNDDGVITQVEFAAGGKRRFERVDTNKDGQLDTAERKAARTQARAAKWRRAHGHPAKAQGYVPGNPQ
jgi:Ca2+-binding EF-hand superfamily protein